MQIGVPAETLAAESRVSVTPEPPKNSLHKDIVY